MKQTLIALMFIGVLFSQDKKEVKAFIMHNIEAGSFDENAIMIPANEKMNKMGKTPKSLPYATSLKTLYEERMGRLKKSFMILLKKVVVQYSGRQVFQKSRTIFIMVREIK